MADARIHLASFLAIGFIAVAASPGCSSNYDAALREIGQTPEQRLASHVASMEQSASRAVKTLEEAATSLKNNSTQTPALAAHRARLVNDADAAVFEYSRNVLIVTDALSAADTQPISGATPLQASMLAAKESLSAAMKSLRARASSSAEPGLVLTPASGSLARNLEQARGDVAAISRYSKPIIAAAEAPPDQHAVSGKRR